MSNRIANELERCRLGWTAGVTDALADALDTCRTHGLPLPDWMHEALAQIVSKVSSSDRMMNAKHYERWDAVTTILEMRPAWKEEARDLRKNIRHLRNLAKKGELSQAEATKRCKIFEERIDQLRRSLTWTAQTLSPDRACPRIFVYAAAALSEDPWHGKVKADAVQRSYREVKKHLKSGAAWGRYYRGMATARKLEAGGQGMIDTKHGPQPSSAPTRISRGVVDPPAGYPPGSIRVRKKVR